MLLKYRLKELGEIFTGNTPSTKIKEYYESEDIMFTKPADINSNITEIVKTQDYISNKASNKARIVPKDSLVVVCIGATVGKIGVTKEKSAFNQQINAIIPNNKIYNSKYLAYAVLSNRQKLIDLANSAVVPIVNKSQFEKFEVNIHDYNEQEKIVNILDKSQELIDKRKKQIEALDELVKSQFIEMFENENFETDELASFIKEGAGLSYGIVVPGDNCEDGIPMIRPIDYINNSINLDNLYKVDKSIEEKYAKTRLNGNEILVTVIGSNMGQIMLTNNKCNGMNVTRNLAVIRQDDNKINKYYLREYLLSTKGQMLLKGQVNTSTIKQLPLNKLKQILIPKPPIELQNRFADFVKQTDKLKFEMEKSLKELEDNFNSLMQKAFKGELFN